MVSEEIYFTMNFFRKSQKIQRLAQKRIRFEDLVSKEQQVVYEYFESKKKQLDRSQKLICRESSIQFVLQNTLIVYQVVSDFRINPGLQEILKF